MDILVKYLRLRPMIVNDYNDIQIKSIAQNYKNSTVNLVLVSNKEDLKKPERHTTQLSLLGRFSEKMYLFENVMKNQNYGYGRTTRIIEKRLKNFSVCIIR